MIKASSNSNTANVLTETLPDFSLCSHEQKQIYLKQLLADQVKLGFLMEYCDELYCTENIRFLVAVAKYRLLFHNDKVEWKPWQVVDTMSPRPKKSLSADKTASISRDIEFISENFLKPSAKLEICLPSSVAVNTRRRMSEFLAYGPEVFREACIDPKITLLRSILPRFVTDAKHEDMLLFSEKLTSLPPMHTLSVPPVRCSMEAVTAIVSRLGKDADCRAYVNEKLDYYFVDPLLYDQLLKHLTKIISSENLLCVRSIDLYLQMYDKYIANGWGSQPIVATSTLYNLGEVISEGLEEDVGDISPKVQLQAQILYKAWKIYLYFVAPNSSFEVGVPYRVYRSVSRNMAAPKRDAFADVRLTALKSLQDYFNCNFHASPCFTDLVKLVKLRQDTWPNFSDDMLEPTKAKTAPTDLSSGQPTHAFRCIPGAGSCLPRGVY